MLPFIEETMFRGFGRKRKMAEQKSCTSGTHKNGDNAREKENDWSSDVIEADELSDIICNMNDEKVLLVDCRSFLEFNYCNIVNSINVCCNKIVKRRLMQNKLQIQEFLSQTGNILVEQSYQVILYDLQSEAGVKLPDDDILSILGRKCSLVFRRVRLLNGGFLNFQQQHPSLLETKTKTPSQTQATASLSNPCMPVSNIGPTKILPYLFLGSMKDALSAEVAKANGITYVLNVSMNCPKASHIQDGHFLRIPVNDNHSEKLLPYFHDAFQFIDKVREANGCVLVHCLAGISRSATLAIAYIMRTFSTVLEEAYRYVKEKRPTISPNFNFLGQLLEYEQQIEKEGNLQFAGSKRKCIDDLRLELSSPSSPVAASRFGKCLALDGSVATKAQSPTSALAKLRFEHCLQGASSPTSALAKLRFGAATSMETSQPISHYTEQTDYLPAYTANSVHPNIAQAEISPEVNSPLGASKRSVSMNVIESYNTNCNNNNSTQSGGSSPVSPGGRPLRPMSLSVSVSGIDTLNAAKPPRRPISLSIANMDAEKSGERIPSTSSSDSSTETDNVAAENSDNTTKATETEAFKQPTSPTIDTAEVVLREHSGTRRARPNSMVVISSPKETVVTTPSSPTCPVSRCHITSAHTAPSSLDMILATAYATDSQRRSRSLEDILTPAEALAERLCRKCGRTDLNEPCRCRGLSDPITKSSNSISSAGSHSSLHGSLELIPVS